MLWSLETVSVLVTLAVAAFASISVYVFLISRVLPDLLLKPLYDDSRDGDRGLCRFISFADDVLNISSKRSFYRQRILWANREYM